MRCCRSRWSCRRGWTNSDDEAGVLSGTPEEEFAERTYVWAATDIDGDRAEMKIAITVESNLKEARARLKADQRVDPAGAVAGDVGERDGRGDAAPGVPGSGRRRPCVGAGGRGVDAAVERTRARGGRGVVEGPAGGRVVRRGPGLPGGRLPGGGVGFGRAAQAVAGQGGAGLVGRPVRGACGRGRAAGRGPAGRPGGVVVRERDQVRGPERGRRRSRASTTAGWRRRIRIWGGRGRTARGCGARWGYGEGEIAIADAKVVEQGFGVQKGDSAFLGVAAGGAVPVLSADGLALALKAAGEATRYSVKDNGSAIAAVSVDTRRLRLAAEGTRTYALPGGGTLAPSLEMGCALGRRRRRDGPGRRGRRRRVLDVGQPGGGGAGAGRWRRTRATWRNGGRRPRRGCRPAGAACRCRCRRAGALRKAASRACGKKEPRLPAAPAARAWRRSLGYGFRTWAGSATPYAGFGYEEGGARRYRLGTRSEFGPNLAVGLEAERKEVAAGADHGVRLELRLEW